MRFACFALLLSAVAISVASLPAQTDNDEFQDVVSYIEYYLSPNDIHELLEAIPGALENNEDSVEDESEAMPRSFSVSIPWNKIVETVQNMSKKDSKFSKVLNLVNDPKFRELVKKTVNSQTLREFAKGVATHGFSWTEFLHLLLHALCSAASTIQHDKYTVGVCQILQNL